MMRRAPIALMFASLLAACSGGGGSPGGGSSHPTPTPSPTSSSGGTTFPGGASPTPTATATATASGSASPTATPTANAACTQSNAAPSAMTYPLTGIQQTVTLPTYNVWNGSATVPATGGGTLTVKDSQNNFDALPTSTTGDPSYASRSKDFYLSAELGQSTTFSTQASIPVTLTSPCISSGVTYYMDAFALGSYDGAISAVASGDSVTVSIAIPSGTFPSGTTIDAVLSH